MGLLYEKNTIDASIKKQNITAFIAMSAPDKDYYYLLLSAAIIAVGGIFTDSIPVVIASMIIAPLSTPIISVGLGIATRDWRNALRHVTVLALSSCIVLVLAAGAAILLNHDRVPNILISFSSDTIISAMVAAVSGAIATIGIVHKKVASAAIGVAIAVSLMPPLVATGVGLAPGGSPFAGSLKLYLINVACIAIASTITFLILGG